MLLKKLALLFLPLLLTSVGSAQISGGISFNDDGLKSFYLAVGETYNVPEREVIIIRERRIPDEEIPVVFFFANRAHVRRDEIVELRLAGRSWMEITLLYHLDPAIFYVELIGDPGPEYGRAYGHWKHPRREWRDIRFEDDDIVKMVNLRFVSNHYGIKPDEVVKLRREHGDFVKVTRVAESPEYRTRRSTQGRDGQGSNDGDRRGKEEDKKKSKGDGGGKGKGHKNH